MATIITATGDAPGRFIRILRMVSLLHVAGHEADGGANGVPAAAGAAAEMAGGDEESLLERVPGGSSLLGGWKNLPR